MRKCLLWTLSLVVLGGVRAETVFSDFVVPGSGPAVHYFSPHAVEAGDACEQAVVIVHGWGDGVKLPAEVPIFAATAERACGGRAPYVMAPVFPTKRTMAKFKQEDDGRAHWCDSMSPATGDRCSPTDDWRGGGDANGSQLSSYDVIDRLFAALADASRYPNLKRVVLAGFSAGGQFAGRYAAVGKGVVRPGVTVEYAPMSPSTWLRLDPDVTWHYGLKDRPRYSAGLSVAQIRTNLSTRRQWNACGLKDVQKRPKTALDSTPEGQSQGANRYERFLSFQAHVQEFSDWKRMSSFYVFEELGHEYRRAYADPQLVAFCCGTSRRSEIAAFFEREVYGKVPPKPAKLAFDLVEKGEAFGGLAERRQYRIVSTDGKGSHSFAVLVYLPKGAERPAPAFVYPNFSGNHSIVDDPAVAVETGAVFGGERRERGSRTDRIPVKRLLERGFALATFCYCSVYPDYAGTDRDAAPESVYAIFPEERLTKPLLAHPAWSWGSMRVRDLLETLPGIDQAHVAVAGQSRMGKNAIVTGVNDDRFALVCANCGGTKQLKLLPNLKYPYWFAPGLRKYAMNGRTGLPVAELEAQARKMPDPPFEQSDYLGLIAPRALCVGAASEDRWSPPEASLACVRAAEPAFERHGRAIGWHCKKGPHSITAEDWEQYMDYALNQLGWHTAFSPAVPSANPDDQMRYIWGSHDGIHPWLKRFGFNTVIHATELETLPHFKADGFDFVRQCGGIVSNPALMKKYPRINRDGTKWERTVDASDPDYRRETHGKFAAVAQKLKALDCRVGVQPASELRIRTRPSHTPRHDAAFKAATGLDVPPEADGREAPHWSKLKDVPADRAIDENHPVLAYYRWFWKEGDGFGPVFADGERTVREALGYVPFSFMDPAIRVPPLWCGCPALSHLSQWQVVDPDPYQHAYIVSEVKAMARGNPGQRTLMMVQGIFGRWDADLRLLKGVDGGKLPDAPAWLRDRPLGLYITPPPDMFRESIWACLSRQIDGVGFHGWNCLFDGVPFGDKKTAAGYVFTNDRTTNVIDEVFNTVAVPLGPLFKAAEERAPEVAVLESYTSALLSGKAPWDWKLAGFHCGVRATAANLAPYTLYEEEIARYGIPLSVKVILAPECEIVTKTTARALREFRARGGRIVGDAKLAPAVTADAQLSADPAELGAIVRRFMTPYAASDRPTLLASARIAGSADLVFVLNDNRTYGDYIGQWKRLREKGLPERGTVTVNRSAGAVYDLVAHQPVPFTSEGGRTAITVAFASCGGKALLVTEKPLGKLAVAREGDELVVRSPDGAMIPVGLFSSDGRPRYGIVRKGVWRTRAPAGSAKVVNLATGEEFQ